MLPNLNLSKPTELAIFVLILISNFLIGDPLSSYLGAEAYTKGMLQLSNVELLSALVLAPVLEELIFRTHLTQNKKFQFTIPIMIIVAVISLSAYGQWVLVMGVVIFFVTIYFLSKSKFEHTRYFVALFFGTALIFTLMHMPNFHSRSTTGDLIIALVSLFPMAVFFGYMRFKYGLVFSILTHSINNLLVLGLNTIFYN